MTNEYQSGGCNISSDIAPSPPPPAKIRPHRRENRIHTPIPEPIKAADRGLVQRPDAEGFQGGNIRRWAGNIYDAF